MKNRFVVPRQNSLPILLLLSVLCVAAALTGENLLQTAPEGNLNVSADYAISTAYAQVSLTLTNRKRAAIVVPVCDSNEVCGGYSYIEQKDPKAGWKRLELPGNPHVSLGKVIQLEPGESTLLLLKYHPASLRFPDGTRLRYPGKVRFVVLAYPEEQWAGTKAMAMEVVSEELAIPKPPDIW